MDAILLAAGLGTRMRPLTDATPKPLLTLEGRTLLDRALDRLADAGVGRVVVNAHWQADKLRAHLAARMGGPRTVVRDEATLLDTGGAVAAARTEGLLGPSSFYVVNGDTVWLDGPVPTLARLAGALVPERDAVILVHRTFQVQADVGRGDFFIDQWGMPRRRMPHEVAPYLYAGVTLARAALFEGWPAGPLSMNAVWDRAIAAGRLVAVVHDGLWFHLSRPSDLEEAAHALAAQLTWSTT